MPELQIPFVTGQHEELDSKVAPDGTIHAVKELVTKRQGRWEKRREYVELTNTASSSIQALLGEVWALGSHRSDRLIAYSQPPALAVHDPTLDIITGAMRQALPAFNAPQRYPVPHELSDDTGELTQTDVVHINGWTVVLWLIGTTARVGWYNETTKTLVAVSVPYTITSTTARLCLSGNYVILVYPSSATALSARSWLSTTTGVQPALSSAWVVASGLASVVGFTANEMRGTGYFIVAGLSSIVTTIEAAMYTWNPASVGAAVYSATGIVLLSGSSGDAFMTVDGHVGDGVLLAFRYDGTSDGLAYVHRNDDLTSDLTFTAIITGSDYKKAPSLLQLTSTTWLVMGDLNETYGSPGYDQGSIVVWEVTEGGSVGSARRHYDVRPASQLFGFTDSAGAVRPYVVAVSDSDTDTADNGSTIFTKNYYLLAIPLAAFFNHADSLRPQGFFGRDVGVQIFAAPNQLPRVSVTSTGTFLFCGPFIAQGSALDQDTFSENFRLGAAVWRFDYQTRDRFQFVTMGAAAYVSGGILTRWNGANLTEAGFLRRPDILQAVGSSSGSLTQLGLYSYVAVYESITNDGEVVRSEPSLPATVTLTGSQDEVVITFRDNKLRSNNQFQTTPEARIYLYRTVANEPGVYYMVHDQDDPIIGYDFDDATVITYSDTTSDAGIQTHAILYSTGILPNVTPPPCRFMARVGNRLVCGGLENPREVWMSAEFVPGEQVAFKDDPAFRQVLHDDVTAVGELDGYPVVFTENSVHSVLGLGPSDAGVGSYELRQIPTDGGSITRHTLTTDEGCVYQSARGIELLPRGFGAPQWVGSPVADSLGSALVTGIVSIGDDVRFSFSGGVLVWNTTWNAWSVFAVGSVYSSTVWDDKHVLGYEDWAETVPIAIEVTTTPTTYINGQFETKDLTLGMIAGYWRAEECIALFEYRGQARVTIAISYDSGLNFPDTISFDLTTGTYSVGQLAPLSFTLPWQKSDRFRFRISDSGHSGGTTGTDGVRYLGMTLTYKVKRGLKRLREGQRG